jgi:hypothetical protein
MRRRQAVALWWWAIAALAIAPATFAQAIRLGGEFQVNSFTSGAQSYPAVALRSTGGFVVVWTSQSQDGSGRGVFGRLFSVNGAALASEFQVGVQTFSDQFGAAVATDTAGRFVVAWEGTFSDDGNATGVVARRFSSNGAATGGEIQVNTYTTGFQQSPAVGVDPNGDFVVVWTSLDQDGSASGVFARRFTSAGTALAAELQVNTWTASNQFASAVATLRNGGFVVVWASTDNQDGNSSGVFARRFDGASNALGPELQVNTRTAGSQSFPSVAADGDGDFVVAWQSDLQDGGAYGIFAQRFASGGAALGAELQINLVTENSQGVPRLTASSGGDFVVTWTSSLQDGDNYGVFARLFGSAGASVGAELQISTFTTGMQIGAAPSSSGNSFVIVWQSQGQDGDGNGVFGQRFAETTVLDIDGNGRIEALTDGLLQLRYLFGFRGAVLITGAVDLATCTRCDATAIEARLAELTG